MSQIYKKENFEVACNLYREWNSKINVVSRKDIDNIFEHHFLHSLSILEYLKLKGESLDGLRILDVGTGGGFPGIPLAMTMPKSSFVLCDSIGKKIKVASEVAAGIGLTNVECINSRAEDVAGEFDWVVSRAVTSLDNFYPWVKGKYRKGILCLKGGDVSEEISVMCSKYGIEPTKVSVWKISNWLKDDYFAEKFVIEVRK